MATLKIKRHCPIGIEARFCKYQETRAKDLPSAMEGDLALFCTIDKLKDCPELKKLQKMLNEVMG